mmetsp:Transcript_26080/g.46233  ORF Transcript_26080/g.46233 Transcript_26080/m.46233 type:complete len:223 (+) Transcript_26080:954-1622(+)
MLHHAMAVPMMTRTKLPSRRNLHRQKPDRRTTVCVSGNNYVGLVLELTRKVVVLLKVLFPKPLLGWIVFYGLQHCREFGRTEVRLTGQSWRWLLMLCHLLTLNYFSRTGQHHPAQHWGQESSHVLEDRSEDDTDSALRPPSKELTQSIAQLGSCCPIQLRGEFVDQERRSRVGSLSCAQSAHKACSGLLTGGKSHEWPLPRRAWQLCERQQLLHGCGITWDL